MQGSRDFDRQNAMLAFLNTAFFSAFNPLWHVLEHEIEPQARAALVAFGRAEVARAHASLERLLDGRAYLLGDRRSLADAYFAGLARWTDYHDIDRRPYSAVQRLYERLQEDPAVRFAHAIEHGEPAAGAGGFSGHVTLAEAAAALNRAA